MKISRSEFDAAALQTSMPSEQAGRLWAQMEANAAQTPRFCAAHVAYYFGALIVISAMGWFMTLGWENFGGAGIFVIATVYAACFFVAAASLWKKKALQIPGGLLATMGFMQ